MRKKCFRFILALCLVLCLSPAVWADSGQCGDNITWDLTDGVLTLTGSGEMYDYNSGSAPWYSVRNSIQEIVVGDGITIIGDNAFCYSLKVQKVTLPDSLTAIGESAFANCYELPELVIPQSVTTIGAEAFSSCKALTTLTLPSGLTEIPDGLFAYSAIASIVIPQGVTTVGERAFLNCWSLSSVTLPDSLVSMGSRCFESCTSLTQIDLPGKLTQIPESCFVNSGLTELVIPESITAIGYSAFSGCSDLVSITIPDTVTSMEELCFRLCTSLTTLDLPNGLTEIPDSCFLESGLTELVIPESVTTIGENAFCGCKNLTSLTIPNTVTHMEDFCFRDCVSLTALDLPESLTEISWGMFMDSGLETLEIPHGVTHIDAYGFKDCESLTDLFIPCTVRDMEYQIFDGCDQLTISCCGNTFIHRRLEEEGLNYQIVPDPEDEIPYPITLDVENHGTVTLSTDSSLQWRYVTFDITPDEGWYVEHVYVYYDSEVELELDLFESPHNHFEFRMSPCKVHIVVTFWNDTDLPDSTDPTTPTETPTEPTTPSETPTEPTEPPTEPTAPTEPEEPAPVFQDVAEGAFYAEAVQWAVEQGVTTGATNTTFAPSKDCTREQIVTFLWRAYGEPEPSGTKNPFTDVNASSYSYKAILWAVEQGITTGMDDTHFAPKGNCTRAQAVTFLWRSQNQPSAGTANPFTDIPSSHWYTTAVLWAYENGITTGATNTTFSPGGLCTRAQIVTFLYRCLA